jgi:plastocyanin
MTDTVILDGQDIGQAHRATSAIFGLVRAVDPRPARRGARRPHDARRRARPSRRGTGVSPRVSPGRRHGGLAAATLATLAAVLLAACGDGASDDSPAPGAEGSGAPASAAPDAGAALTVEAHDIEFDSDAYRIAAGPVDIEYQQNGTLPHTLVIEEAGGALVAGFELEVGDDDADRGTVDLPPGEYVFYCDVSGHRGAGMDAELQVE